MLADRAERPKSLLDIKYLVHEQMNEGELLVED